MGKRKERKYDMKNLIIIVADALRWDYFLKRQMWRIFNENPVDQVAKPTPEAKLPDSIPCSNNSKVFRCWSAGGHTGDSVPVIMTGISLDKINKNTTHHPACRIYEKTLFNFFEEKGYLTAYNNIDHRSGLYGILNPQKSWTSLFDDFPPQIDLNSIFSQTHTPFVIGIHSWFTHDPYSFFRRNTIFNLLTEYIHKHNTDAIHNIYKHGLNQFEIILKQLIYRIKIDTELYKSTLIVMVGDHGDFLGETVEGEVLRGHEGPNGMHPKFKNHKLLREVPLLFYHPSLGSGTIVTKPLSNHIDIMPTILSLMQLDIPKHLKGRVLINI